MIRREYNFNETQEVLDFIEHFTLNEIIDYADFLRERYFKNNIELCSIYNVKSGRCSEDCKYCAQSSFYNTKIDQYEIGDLDSILNLETDMESRKVRYFSLVSSGRALTDSELKKILNIFDSLRNKNKINLCASLGFLDVNTAKKLVEKGVKKYHHNLETGPNYFDKICTTHNYQDKLNTIKIAQEAGLTVCSGGILGIGETLKDRIDMAITLKKLGIKSIPINILRPIKGTPLQDIKPLDEDEVLLSIALFRIINPMATIRIAGGRPFFRENENKKLIKSGINAFMVGNYLTTTGIPIEKDIEFFNKGFNIIQKI